MRYRRLGGSGCKVSVIGLGNWLTYGNTVPQEVANRCVRAAFDGGVNFFDTADIYNKGEGEIALAAALKPFRRRDYVLATKCFFPMTDNVNDQGLSRKHVFESLHDSLRRLGTDYVDLYQCHRFDPETRVEEVVRAMDDLVRLGKVLYWGVSCWDAEPIEEACHVGDRFHAYRPITNQPPYNLLERGIETTVLPTCVRLGLSQIVFSPLAQGLLTGKYGGGRVPKGSRAGDDRAGQFLRPRLTPQNLAAARHAADIARQAGITPAQLALSFVLRREEVSSAIIGATHPDQVVENLKAADLTLDQEVLNSLGC